jgi:hypothetical protein
MRIFKINLKSAFKILIFFSASSLILFTITRTSVDYKSDTNVNQMKKGITRKSIEFEGKERVIKLYDYLKDHEKKFMSQNGEDGVIISLIKTFNLEAQQTKTFVEIGANMGVECNTKYVKDFLKWKGVQFDASMHFEERDLYQEVITHENVLSILEKYNVTLEFDLLSEDTDYADYWILEKLLTKYRPKLIVHEVNQQTPDRCITVEKPSVAIFWRHDIHKEYTGGSVCAFYCLAKSNRYTMIYCESAGVNCFWVRNDLIEKYLKVNAANIQLLLDPHFLFRKPKFDYGPTLKKWHEVSC